jgi:prepilin-type N-terminal cleavage/methylation domain-containing protein
MCQNHNLRDALESSSHPDTLMEVLCVTAIILILAALYLPAIAKAYKRIVTFLGGF